MAAHEPGVSVERPPRPETVRPEAGGRPGGPRISELLELAGRMPEDAVLRHHGPRTAVGEHRPGDVPDPREAHAPLLRIELGDRRRRPAGRAERFVQPHENVQDRRAGRGGLEHPTRLARRGGRVRAVPDAVGDHHEGAARLTDERPGVAALGLSRLRDADALGPDALAPRRRPGPEDRDNRGAAVARVRIERRREPPDRAEAGPGAAGRRVAVAQALREVRDAGSPVERDHADPAQRAVARDAEEELALARVLHEVRPDLAHDERDLARLVLVEPEPAAERARGPTRHPHLARVRHAEDELVGHFHRVIATRVPSPGRDESSNSFERRFAPPRPSPRPPAVEKPSFMARSVSAMPGPWSSKTRRSPRRSLWFSASSRTVPPPPWRVVFRASSLAAVTIFVWSTRLKPTATAHSRTTCRTATMSSDERIARVSSRRTAIPAPAVLERLADQRDPLLDVQRRAHAGQCQTELDERDRDRRTHADDGRLRVEDARHRGDVAEHPADEGIDDLERRDVDEHAARAMLRDPLGEIVLQGHRETVVHVHLDGDEQAVTHLEDRDALHRTSAGSDGEPAAIERHGEGVGDRCLRDDALQLDPEMHDRLRDLRPDAADDALGSHEPRGGNRLQEVLRDERVDGGHAGDVDDRDPRAGGDDLLEEALHHDLRPGAVERADQREREDALPELDDRRRELQHLLLLARDDLFAPLLVDLGGEEAERIEEARRGPRLGAERIRVARELAPERGEERLLQREDEGRRLRRREALACARTRDVGEELAHLRPLRAGDVHVGAAAVLERRPQEGEEAPRLLAQLVGVDQVASDASELVAHPVGEDVALVLADDVRDPARCRRHDVRLLPGAAKRRRAARGCSVPSSSSLWRQYPPVNDGRGSRLTASPRDSRSRPGPSW